MFEDKFFKEMESRFNRIFRDLNDNNFNLNIEDNFRKAMIDFNEEENGYSLYVELPGIEKKDINLDVDDNEILIEAIKKHEKENNDNEKNIYSYSKSFIGFKRKISLPDDVDSDNVEAFYNNGLLIIRIPKRKLNFKKKEVKIN